ncbi:helix-turn-helix transcriptional regulator [Eisenbergiella sp.]
MVNRLFGICYQLMQRDKIPAKELAERYEVSVRTIYRDVEMLSMAGVPIYASKGRSGGISLLDHSLIDKMFITPEEKKQILAALESLQEVEPPENSKLLRKLGDFFQTPAAGWVSVDFSDWSGRRQELFTLLKNAILQSRVIAFDYYTSDGRMERRVVEPVQLWFKNRAWYLRAWCRSRQAMRTFKILRIKRPECLEEYFPPRSIPVTEEADAAPNAAPENPVTHIRLEVDAAQTYRIYDFFEEEEITVMDNGNFLVDVSYVVDEWVYSLIISLCPHVRIIEPLWLKEKIAEMLQKALENI